MPRYRSFTPRRVPRGSNLAEGELPFGPGDPGATALSISEFVARINGALRAGFPETWVKGEVSEWRVWSSGHAYFTLKDASASIAAVMWADSLSRMPFRAEVGMEVLARGRPDVWAKTGKLSFVVAELQPAGAGALQLAFEQLKARLAAEGLFGPARKRKLPLLPRRIGVVTSLGGAAVHDILRVLSLRFPNAHVTIYPARVQGEGAAEELANAVSAFSRAPSGADVLIVARGGGSKEDLAAFNDERVVRAVAASAVPTVSAVGHEVDVTLTDLAADVRAATPSQAAELVVERREDFEKRLAGVAGDLRRIVRGKLAEADAELKGFLLSPGFAAFPGAVNRWQVEFEGASAALVATFRALPQALGERLARLDQRLRAWPARAALPHRHRSAEQLGDVLAERMKGTLAAGSGRLAALSASLDALSPLKVLSRGYSVTYRDGEAAPLRDAAQVSAGDPLRILLHRGALRARVTGTEVRDDES
ncbi:MAG TPA: exodeoxyribonuclease VII large subunit [Thermoanaerobaculia bacterium]|nr:exodeoxyribonuclease VII large subunit [Thermoanaerobaculia bacterium]